ncbi:MAG: preprotein translocase subunit YajC [Oscillospiraceae bacterium]|nr:preprotein translocase subunit YajC [Oscillospiraceae bacterium]
MGSMLLPLALMLALMYFLMIRPENKRKKQAEEMRNSLKKGDQITTIGGIVGKIVHVGEESIIIETSDDRVRMELTKWAVSTNNSNPPADKKGKKAKEAKEEPAKIEEGSDNETK